MAAPWIIFGLLVLGFAALLIRELGHALAFRRYGVASTISFWILGGFTVTTDPAAAERLNDRPLVVVSVAGPLVGLVVGVAILAVAFAARGQSELIRVPIFLWLFVNLGWAIFNLLPISSLDGGQVLRHLAGAIFGRPGRAIGLVATLLASAAIVALSAAAGLYTIALVARVFGLLNPSPYRELRDEIWPATRPRPESETSGSPNPTWSGRRGAIRATGWDSPGEHPLGAATG